MKKHILLLRPDKAGDAIKTLPTLRALQKKFPDDHFHILASHHNVSLFAYEKGVRIYILPQGWENLSEEHLKAALNHLGFSGTFDITINLLSDQFAEVDRLLKLLPTRLSFSNHRNLKLPENSPVHRNEVQNIALLVSEALNADITGLLNQVDWAPVIPVIDQEEAKYQMSDKRGIWLGFCPFAGTSNRTHPDRHWQTFFRKVTRFGDAEKYFLFGSKQDRLRLQKIQSMAFDPSRVEVIFPSSFRALGAYLQNVDGMVAVDSGPLHLAHALHIPSLGFLSGGDYRRWFPSLGAQDRIVKRGLFNRYPSRWEMVRAFKQWREMALTNA